MPYLIARFWGEYNKTQIIYEMSISPSFGHFCKRLELIDSEVIAILNFLTNISDYNSRRQLYQICPLSEIKIKDFFSLLALASPYDPDDSELNSDVLFERYLEDFDNRKIFFWKLI